VADVDVADCPELGCHRPEVLPITVWLRPRCRTNAWLTPAIP